MSPARLSAELRTGRNPDLTRRRWALGLSFGGAVIGMVVGAYQTGMIRRLPDIAPGRLFDAEKVDASDYAYKRAQTADGLLMIVTYAVTAALVGAGGANRAGDQRPLALAAAAKAAADVVLNMKLAREEWADNQALCSWCQLANVFSVATLALLTPEALRAARA
ncbi:MAG: vitamin K epoxide reductase [Alphaproteobacteria bacterium]|nr:MAG: vitamin K epoxide reductase [Alphaproteobacteria bacterium]